MINWFCHMYPYGNLHELNLDWVIDTVKRGEQDIANFIGVNTIKYANPILWNIESQYEANTVVVDGQTGNAYISVKPVPSGVHLSRTEYWTQIYNYANVVDTLREQIAHNEGESTTATIPYSVGDLVFIDGELYRVIAPMIAGDSFVVDSNVVKTTIENEIRLAVLYAIQHTDTLVGLLSDLDTNDKTNIVNAINEVLSSLTSANADINNKIGLLSALNTIDKTSLVNAINEVLSSLTSASVDINSKIGVLSELTTDDKTNLVNAINSNMSFTASVYNSSERNLKTRHFLVLGDSYGDEDGEWTYYTQLFLGVDDNHWHVVAEGGAGFVSNGTILFINQLINYTGNKEEITDIIVCGGANDSVSSSPGDTWWSTVQNNMEAFNNYAKEHYPNAKISLGFIANGVDYLEGGVVSGRVYECREMCKYFYNSKGSELGWNILNNIDLTLSQSVAFISSDGLHPSIFGSNALGHSISQAILTGTCEIIYPLSNACDSTQFNGNSQFKYVVRNDKTILSFNDFYITAGNITNTFKIAKMNTIGFNKSFSIPCVARIDNYDNLDFQIIPARLVFDKSDVYLDLYKITSDGTYKTSFTADVGETGYVRVNDIDIIVPTRYLA